MKTNTCTPIMILPVLLAALFEPSIQSARGQTFSFSVPVTAPWFDTGIDIKAGSRLTMAAPGIVYYGVLHNIQYADANGVGPERDGTGKFPGTVYPSVIGLSLIGKIGGTTTVGTGTAVPEGLPGHGAGFVGSAYNQIIPVSGRLFLGYNDDLFFDNSGVFNMSGTLTPPPHVTIQVGDVDVCWNSKTNTTYQVQYRSDMTTNQWTNLGAPIAGNGSTNCITDSVREQPRRFYRVVCCSEAASH